MDRLYDAVNGRMSRGQCMWTFGVLSVVAATFGLALWAWTGNRCDKVETEIQTIQVRAERITADLEHIKAAQEEQKAEGKQLRADMMTEFRRLTDVVKHAP